MKQIKKFFKKCDLFSVPFSFRYRNNDTFSTFSGGFLSIIFCVIAFLFGINFFIAFCKRKNFSLFFNSINKKEKEGINFDSEQYAIAIRFDCDKKNNEVTNYLKLEVKYKKKNFIPENISTVPCKESKYFTKKNDNKFTDLDNLFCLNEIDKTIKGTHKDDEFDFYEISILSKDNSISDYKKVDKFLLENECKVEFYFTDISMDFTNYKEPFDTFINEIFIQLNPDLYVKMNAFFMHQYFYDENSLFHEIREKEKEKNIVFSRYEQYSLYKGMVREEENSVPDNYNIYGKIFIRADTKRIEIKRKYPNLMEFYADTFSFWVAIFYLLYLLFYIFNSFYSYISLEKNLFFFKNVENKYFNVSQNNEKIESLINLTNNLLKKNNNDERVVRESLNPRSRRRGALHLLEQNSTEEQLRENENNRDINPNIQRKEENISDLKYSFNILEFIFVKLLCKCCISKKLKRKKNLLTEANAFLDKKLDIIFYVRNMISLDILNQIILGNEKKGINKLLITPIISGKEKEEEIEENNYNQFSEVDFNNYYDEIIQMNENQNMSEIEKKIINLCNEKMKKIKSSN